MPIYEYQCAKCGVFEVTQRITEKALKKCPTCKSKVERIISSTSFVLKGSGWYVTDYARSGNSKSEGDSASDSSKSASDASSSSDSSSKSGDSATKSGDSAKSGSKSGDSAKAGDSSSKITATPKPAAEKSAS